MVRPHPAVDLYDYVSKQKRLKESLARYLSVVVVFFGVIPKLDKCECFRFVKAAVYSDLCIIIYVFVCNVLKIEG